MRIRDMRIHGIRCFKDTGDFSLGSKCSVLVGKNNAGKSTILKAILGLQGFPFDNNDVRPGNENSSFTAIRMENVLPTEFPSIGRANTDDTMRVITAYGGAHPTYEGPQWGISSGHVVFPPTRPNHVIVPFVAKRKASAYNESVTEATQAEVKGTFANLYSRIDLLANYGHSGHEQFVNSVLDIVGLRITTRASGNGKVAGFYFSDNKFIPLDRMGDGVAEMVALIVELCVEKGKIFVIEEPETNLHPSGLKALLALIRAASETNQFIIATHSNIVVRELGAMDGCKVLRVYRGDEASISPSKVEEVENSPTAHMELLRELGYEFADFNLYAGWLFLEEASAERVLRDILIPNFVPELNGRLRTYSSAGAAGLEPSVAEFRRLIVFVHLQELYKGRLWVRADGDDAGKEAIGKIKAIFPDFNSEALSTFSEPDFEKYYPNQFAKEVSGVLAEVDKQQRRKRKMKLLQDVLNWTEKMNTEAFGAWEKSAAEPIALLKSINEKLKSKK